MRMPFPLYILFPVIWVVIFSSLSIYDGRKFLRAADELAALFLSTFIAAVSSAGILYFSFREVSARAIHPFRDQHVPPVSALAGAGKTYFRTRPRSSMIARRLVVVGIGPLGQGVGKQIKHSRSENLTLVGFVDDGYDEQKGKLAWAGWKNSK